MASRDLHISYEHHMADAVNVFLDQICAAYADAYGVTPGESKTDAFRLRASRALERPGFELVTAFNEKAIIGFAFGYPLPAGDTYWWNGLRPHRECGFAEETGQRTFVLAEIEVRRTWQNLGVGKRLHDELLAGRNEERATLASNPKASETHAIYRKWGWQRVGQVPGSSGDYFDAYDLYILPLR